MVLPAKKVPPPPKQPGTHTNAEVKEALHARALRRTIIITAVVILLLAALAVVSSTAQEYQGEDDTTHYPKAVVIVAQGLTPETWARSMRSNKSPFTRLLDNKGGFYTNISALYGETPAESGNAPAVQSNLVRILTGSSTPTVQSTLEGATSFLRTLKSKFKPVIAAPSTYWSSNQMDNVDKECTRVGFFDAECTGTACPENNEKAYCNAFRKYVTCNDATELYTDDIIKAFTQTLTAGGDLLYVQLTNFNGDDNVVATAGHILEARSDVNLLDGTIGRIAMALAERTKVKKENWLIIVTSEGANKEAKAPLLMAAYSDGQMVQLKRPAKGGDAKTADIRDTLLKWFDVDTKSIDPSRVLGVCSTGAHVANCGNSTSA